MPRLSANLSYLFTELPFEDRIAAAAEAGFKGVEFSLPAPYDGDQAKIGDLIACHELTLTVMDAPGGDEGTGLAALKGRETEFHDTIQRALEWADFMGCKLLNIPVGVVEDEDDFAKAFEVLAGNLRYAAREAKEWEINILIEPLNPYDHPGTFLTRPDDGLTLLDEVDEGNLRILFDLYHAQRMQGGLSDFIEMHMDLISHMRIAGVPLRDEPDAGEVNTGYILNLLDAHGYPGWVGCTYVPRAGTKAGLKWGKAWGLEG